MDTHLNIEPQSPPIFYDHGVFLTGCLQCRPEFTSEYPRYRGLRSFNLTPGNDERHVRNGRSQLTVRVTTVRFLLPTSSHPSSGGSASSSRSSIGPWACAPFTGLSELMIERSSS